MIPYFKNDHVRHGIQRQTRTANGGLGDLKPEDIDSRALKMKNENHSKVKRFFAELVQGLERKVSNKNDEYIAHREIVTVRS